MTHLREILHLGVSSCRWNTFHVMRWLTAVPVIGATYSGLPSYGLFLFAFVMTAAVVSVSLRTDHPLRSFRDRYRSRLRR